LDFAPRFFKDPGESFFLFGPRGTGKSTWLRTELPGALRVDLLDPETFRQFNARPERLMELVRGEASRRVVVLDEVQRVPELLPAVHLLMEEDKQRRFVLTGSSARKLKRVGTDLLAGRALLTTMHPFLAAELGAGFDLDVALRLGLLPVVLGSPNPAETLRTYAALYVREEVQAEGLVRNLGAFSRFLEVAAFSHASTLNVLNVARECGVERKAAESYFQILDDLLLAFRLPVFTKRAARALVAHSKWYYVDAGVFRSLRPAGPLDRPSEIDGAALEGLVAEHLRAWTAYSGARHTLAYWRTRSGVEVDFVVYGPDTFVAVEVKNTATVRSEDLKGLTTFLEDYPEASGVFLYRGKQRLKKGPVTCVPVDLWLRGLAPGRSLG